MSLFIFLVTTVIFLLIPSPALSTPIVSSRIRYCLSAAHTKADLDRILRATDEIGGILGLKLSPHGPRMKVDDVIAEGVEMVRDTERELEMALTIEQ